MLLLLLLTGIYSCKKEGLAVTAAAPVNKQNLLQVIQNNFQYGLFYYGIKKTGLDSLLRTAGPFTIFVPDDAGFALVGLGSQHALDSLDPAFLKSLLLYHIIPQQLFFKDIPPALDNEYTSVSGLTLFVSEVLDPLGSNSRLTVNGHFCKQFDVAASNGVIQVLQDKPLNLPQRTVGGHLTANPNYSYFVAALKRFGLFDQLNGTGPITVFAPVNAAFDNYGIGIDSINAMDTLRFKKYLFGCYILNPDRAFLADFGFLANTSPGLYTPGEGMLTYSNSLAVTNGNVNSPTYLGGQALVINADTLMSNGVVQGINDLVVYPQNELK